MCYETRHIESSLTFSLNSCGQQPKFNGMSKGLSRSKAKKIGACCLKRQLAYDIQQLIIKRIIRRGEVKLPKF